MAICAITFGADVWWCFTKIHLDVRYDSVGFVAIYLDFCNTDIASADIALTIILPYFVHLYWIIILILPHSDIVWAVQRVYVMTGGLGPDRLDLPMTPVWVLCPIADNRQGLCLIGVSWWLLWEGSRGERGSRGWGEEVGIRHRCLTRVWMGPGVRQGCGRGEGGGSHVHKSSCTTHTEALGLKLVKI